MRNLLLSMSLLFALGTGTANASCRETGSTFTCDHLIFMEHLEADTFGLVSVVELYTFLRATLDEVNLYISKGELKSPPVSSYLNVYSKTGVLTELKAVAEPIIYIRVVDGKLVRDTTRGQGTGVYLNVGQVTGKLSKPAMSLIQNYLNTEVDAQSLLIDEADELLRLLNAHKSFASSTL